AIPGLNIAAMPFSLTGLAGKAAAGTNAEPNFGITAAQVAQNPEMMAYLDPSAISVSPYGGEGPENGAGQAGLSATGASLGTPFGGTGGVGGTAVPSYAQAPPDADLASGTASPTGGGGPAGSGPAAAAAAAGEAAGQAAGTGESGDASGGGAGGDGGAGGAGGGGGDSGGGPGGQG